jgi:hypothetical protein
MKPAICVHEQSVLEAVNSDRWSEFLRRHLEDCALCQEAIQVSSLLRTFAGTADQEHRLPDSRLIWLKAQLAQRQTAAAEVLRPLELFHRIAYGVIGLLAAALFWMKWPRIEVWLTYLNSSWSAVFASSELGALLVPWIALTLGLLSIAAVFSLYSIFAEE